MPTFYPTCHYCGEQIRPREEIAPGDLWVDGVPAKTHRECALRAVLGGIGHLENHQYWCLSKNDPDAGLSYRESSLRADEWVASRAQQPYPNPEDE
jgi:hypothetical protein